MSVRMIDVLGSIARPPDESGGYRMVDVLGSVARPPDESGGYRMIDVLGSVARPPDESGGYRMVEVLGSVARSTLLDRAQPDRRHFPMPYRSGVICACTQRQRPFSLTYVSV
jgi:hypothetical protein